MSVGTSEAPFSLEEWYATLAPLQDKQRLSVSRISAWTSTESEESEEKDVPKAAGEGSSLAAFLARVADEVDAASATQHDAQIEALKQTIADLDALLASIDACQVNMAEMRAGLAFVEESAQELMGQAEGMMAEQSKLDKLAEQISLRLSYFSVLPQATALVSSPTNDIVETRAFLDMLKRLELALQFMNSNSHYSDAQLYQMRISHCLVRVMTMVRLQFAKRGAQTTDTALAQLQEVNHTRDFTSDTATLDLYSGPMTEALYGGFVSLQASFRPLFAELEQLETPSAAPSAALIAVVPASGEEYHEILEECRATFCRWRMLLAKESLRMYLNDHGRRIQSPQDLAFSLEQAAGFVHGLACQEVALYTTFFCAASLKGRHESPSAPTRLLHALGEQLLAFASSSLPSTPHELAALCAVFQTMPPPKATALPLATSGSDLLDAEQQHQRALAWMQPVLHDLCTRLVKSANAVIKSDIVSFAPKHEDLLYPQVLLEQRQAIAEEQAALAKATREKVLKHTKRASAVGAGLLESLVGDRKALALFSQPSAAVYASWYVPVRTSLELLATLHTHVPIASLIDVGMKCIDGAQSAVAHAANLLRDGKYGAPEGAVGAVDGHLFQLRHLFVLQELFYSVEIASRSAVSHAANDPSDMQLDAPGMQIFGVRVADASVVLDTINSLWSATRFLSSEPKVPPLSHDERSHLNQHTQTALDTTRQQLHTSIVDASAMTSELASANLALPLQIFLAQAQRAAPDASKALAAWTTFQQSLDVNLDELREKVLVYISDDATVANIMDTVVVRARN